MTEVLGQEVRPYGIRVAIVEPGFFKTPMLDEAIASIDLDAGSPYADAERRIHGVFTQGREAGGDPQQVAEAIARAATDEEPRLRYPVGLDSEVFIDGRHRMSDTEWIDFGRERSDDEFWQEFMERFPLPVEA